MSGPMRIDGAPERASRMRHAFVGAALAVLAACAQEAPAAPDNGAPIAPVATDLPAGAYTLDPAHASLVFSVDHLGFSRYVARFTRWDAELELDPADPASARVAATIDPASLALDNPPAGFLDQLLGPQWLDVAQFPEWSFRSTAVELTGANTARIRGELAMHGVTQPVTLEATFNGGWAGIPPDPNARIGFSARGRLSRSAFGVALGVPPEGSTMGVSDEVAIAIEAEFTGPPWTPPAQ